MPERKIRATECHRRERHNHSPPGPLIGRRAYEVSPADGTQDAPVLWGHPLLAIRSPVIGQRECHETQYAYATQNVYTARSLRAVDTPNQIEAQMRQQRPQGNRQRHETRIESIL